MKKTYKKLTPYSVVFVSFLFLLSFKSAQIESTYYYPTMEEADRALEHYENFLLRSELVHYVAVVENSLKKGTYKLEIGVRDTTRIKVDTTISPKNAYSGDFGDSLIPKYMPIPPKLKIQRSKSLQELLSLGFISKKESIEPNISLTSQFVIQEPNSKKLNSLTNWNSDIGERTWIEPLVDRKNKNQSKEASHQSSSISFKENTPSFPIMSAHLKGTLGGLFELEDFPEELFGISNWHVISAYNYYGTTLCVNYNSSKICGELFWSSLDKYREVAFVKFNKKTTKSFMETPESEKWGITGPEINMEVKHNGKKSGGQYKSSRIHSVNATVKIVDGSFKNRKQIFKKQLLIEKFSEDGDSGGLVYREIKVEKSKKIKKEVVGLIFGRTIYSYAIEENEVSKSYTVANNINMIFNTNFSHEQEVFRTLNPKTKSINTVLINQFKLKKNKFY